MRIHLPRADVLSLNFYYNICIVKLHYTSLHMLEYIILKWDSLFSFVSLTFDIIPRFQTHEWTNEWMNAKMFLSVHFVQSKGRMAREYIYFDCSNVIYTLSLFHFKYNLIFINLKVLPEPSKSISIDMTEEEFLQLNWLFSLAEYL